MPNIYSVTKATLDRPDLLRLMAVACPEPAHYPESKRIQQRPGELYINEKMGQPEFKRAWEELDSEFSILEPEEIERELKRDLRSWRNLGR